MITKRTQNASLIRYKVVNYLVDSCQKRDFQLIYVSEICKAAGISKVTFFKYFDHKEDVLMFYQSLINTQICIDVSNNDLHSLAGLEQVVEQFAGIIRETPSLASEITSTLLHTKPPILPVILTESDKALFFPEVNFEVVNHLSFLDLIEGFMLEGVLGNEITIMANAAELTTMFMAMLYGAIVASHIKGNGQESAVFDSVTRNWLRNLR